MFFADPEELCGAEGSIQSTCRAPGIESHDALLQRAQSAEERACRSEEALARAMDDLHKLKLVSFMHFQLILIKSLSVLLSLVLC